MTEHARREGSMRLALAVVVLISLSGCNDRSRIEKLEERVAVDEGRANVFSARIAKLEAENIDLETRVQVLVQGSAGFPERRTGPKGRRTE
jgi:hypothetical protein